MKKNHIKSFSVYGLFGTSNVHIRFDEDIKILIGENGLGKTQVLNLFYYTLTRNFFKLGEFDFDKLRLNFSKGDTIEISKSDINDLAEATYQHPMAKAVIDDIGLAQFEILRNKFMNGHRDWRKIDERLIASHGKSKSKFPVGFIFKIFEDLDIRNNKSHLTKHIKHCKKEIDKYLADMDIVYFPTYRRVEEDLHNLGYDDDELKYDQEQTLIQFGMDDVQKRFNKIQDRIDQLLKEGLAEFTKDILSVVIDDVMPTNTLLDKISESDIDLILSRIGNLLPQSQKIAVKDLVAKKQLKNPLSAYLLQKLIDIYEKQKALDLSVKVFRDICNKYLINKEVFYDESAIKIYIKSNSTDAEILLNKLSSGEKQIISMFAKIYLSDTDKRFMVLFDEPELSLSVTWQRQLLPDIIHSGKCDFLLAVTHSPFIFDNELDKYAVGLNESIEPLKVAVA